VDRRGAEAQGRPVARPAEAGPRAGTAGGDLVAALVGALGVAVPRRRTHRAAMTDSGGVAGWRRRGRGCPSPGSPTR
jgi:hypothetical protein